MHNSYQLFQECIFICDKNAWISDTIRLFLARNHVPFLQLSPNTSMSSAWTRLKDAPKILVHWESNRRHGGNILEEIISTEPKFELETKFIAICWEALPEDLVYLKELNITNVVDFKKSQLHIKKTLDELHRLLFDDISLRQKQEGIWRKLFAGLDQITENTSAENLKKMQINLQKIGSIDNFGSDRYFYGLGLYHLKTGDKATALSNFERAVDINPLYSQAKEALVKLYNSSGRQQEALAILKQMQARNKNNISHLVLIGDIHLALNNVTKAEHYYNSALSKDQYCGAALNGLALLKFNQGKLQDSQTLLSQSSIAEQAASNLNNKGILLVKQGKYKEALELFQQAHFVLPAQGKDSMLFYNAGLCSLRWGRKQQAKKYLELALIKNPSYQKAERLLAKLSSR